MNTSLKDSFHKIVICQLVFLLNNDMPILWQVKTTNKLKLTMKFFKTFPECSLQKTTIKMTGHHASLREVTGKSYFIYACTRVNQARHSSVQVIFCGS